MPLSPKPEFPPLLPIGFHEMTLPVLRELCVGKFAGSQTRSTIMAGVEAVVGRLDECGLQAEVWVDGSFLTAKRNPNDSDLVVFYDSELHEYGTPEQREVLDWIGGNLRNSAHICDSYLAPRFPKGSEHEVYGQYLYSYWHRQFGFSRGDDMKGIAVLMTGRQA